ncbi:efflux RND transporter periplasmic adaptor subunit [Calothrix rhizosoleniae]|uniref:efflux RND transporter periplasmic adaptor subunit n=1 Tax=Calothrix rhizosoleniae TaxID=888997 RepID=UPI0038992311
MMILHKHKPPIAVKKPSVFITIQQMNLNLRLDRTEDSKKLHEKICLLPQVLKFRYIALIAAFFSIGLLSASCGSFPKESADAQSQRRGAGRNKGGAISVDVGIARLKFLRLPAEYTGTTMPFRTVSLRSQVQGQLLELNVDVGDNIKQGQIVAQIDDALLKTALNEAQAELAALKSEVAKATSQISNARVDVERARLELLQARADAKRQEKLLKEGAIAKQTAEQTRTVARTNNQLLRAAQEKVRTEQQALATAKGRLSAQVAVVAQAKERKSYGQVKSPITGVVLEKMTEPGNLLQPGNEIIQIADFNRVKVIVEVSELELSNIQRGKTAKVRLDAFPDQKYLGSITRISPAADSTARLVPVEIVVLNDDGKIGSGLLSRITFKSDAPQNIVAPLTAIQSTKEAEASQLIKNSKVFVVTSKGGKTKVTARKVTLGRQADGKVEILSGLQPGESYVLRSSKPLKDGDPVKISILSEKSATIR